MHKPVEREWELTIGPETVRMLADKARAISAALADDYDDGKEHEVEIDDEAGDRHRHDGLAEEEEQNLTEEEFRQLVADLNVDEAAELVAIAWLGRGDYEAVEWSEAVSEAKRRGSERVASYLLGMPMLGDWLDAGLDLITAS